MLHIVPLYLSLSMRSCLIACEKLFAICELYILWEIASKAKQYVWRVRYGSIRIMLRINELYRKYLCPSKTDEPILNFSASLYFCVCHVVIAFTIYMCNARKKDMSFGDIQTI